MEEQAEYIITGHYILGSDLQTDALEILPGSTISAPEGMRLLFTVNGAAAVPVPGFYTGDVKITVCDGCADEAVSAAPEAEGR